MNYKKTKLKMISIVLSVVVLVIALVSACSKPREKQDIIEEVVVYYGTYGAESDGKIDALLKELDAVDKESGAKWREITNVWKTVEDIPINYDVLPDGLPDTDELCMVALGFQLNPDGSIRDELKERLEVVYESAQKYPNAYIVCTGGGTAAENKDVTEAGQMADWLIKKGIDEDRIIVGDKSMTTAQNAMFSLDILEKEYPKVKQLAIISSDYHIATGDLLFEAEAILRDSKEGAAPKVVSNAAYKAPSGELSSMFQAGALIELSGDEKTAYDIYYDTYDIHELPPLE